MEKRFIDFESFKTVCALTLQMKEIKINAMESLYELFCRVPTEFAVPKDLKTVNPRNIAKGKTSYYLDEIGCISALCLASTDTFSQLKSEAKIDAKLFVKGAKLAVRCTFLLALISI